MSTAVRFCFSTFSDASSKALNLATTFINLSGDTYGYGF